jgi:hypothetical protein
MLNQIPLGYYVLSAIINSIASVGLLVFVLFKNAKSYTNRTFSLFAASVAGWSLCYFLWLNTTNDTLADIYLRTLMIFVIFIPTTFTHFILTFLDIKNSRPINLANYVISGLLSLTVYSSLFAKDASPFLVFPYWLQTSTFFHIHSIHFFGNIIFSHFLMFKRFKYSSGILRNQILYVFLGTGIGYIAGGLNYLTWYRFPIPPFLNLFVSIYVCMIAYAIVKYHLMDIRVAATRAGIFLAVYSFVLGVPFWLGYVRGYWKSATWLMLILATLGPFIFMFLQRKAEGKILETERRIQELLARASSSMRSIKKVDELLELIIALITRTLNVSSEMMSVFTRQRFFQKVSATALFRLNKAIFLFRKFKSLRISWFVRNSTWATTTASANAKRSLRF